MTVRKPFLSALVACFGLALFVASCAKPSGAGSTCSSGQTDCGNGSCVNLMGNDSQNCGACGNKCGAGSSCQNGTCSCASPLLKCNGACVQQDNGNCGQCGHTCTGSTPMCSGGTCTSSCQPNEMACTAGACIDVTS